MQLVMATIVTMISRGAENAIYIQSCMYTHVYVNICLHQILDEIIYKKGVNNTINKKQGPMDKYILVEKQDQLSSRGIKAATPKPSNPTPALVDENNANSVQPKPKISSEKPSLKRKIPNRRFS